MLGFRRGVIGLSVRAVAEIVILGGGGVQRGVDRVEARAADGAGRKPLGGIGVVPAFIGAADVFRHEGLLAVRVIGGRVGFQLFEDGVLALEPVVEHRGDPVHVLLIGGLGLDHGGQRERLVQRHAAVGGFFADLLGQLGVAVGDQLAHRLLRVLVLEKLVGVREQVALQTVIPLGAVGDLPQHGEILVQLGALDHGEGVLRGADAAAFQLRGDLRGVHALRERHLDGIHAVFGGLDGVDQRKVIHTRGDLVAAAAEFLGRVGHGGVQPEEAEVLHRARLVEDLRDLGERRVLGDLHRDGDVLPAGAHHVVEAGHRVPGQQQRDQQHHREPDEAEEAAVPPALFLVPQGVGQARAFGGLFLRKGCAPPPRLARVAVAADGGLRVLVFALFGDLKAEIFHLPAVPPVLPGSVVHAWSPLPLLRASARGNAPHVFFGHEDIDRAVVIAVRQAPPDAAGIAQPHAHAAEAGEETVVIALAVPQAVALRIEAEAGHDAQRPRFAGVRRRASAGVRLRHAVAAGREILRRADGVKAHPHGPRLAARHGDPPAPRKRAGDHRPGIHFLRLADVGEDHPRREIFPELRKPREDGRVHRGLLLRGQAVPEAAALRPQVFLDLADVPYGHWIFFRTCRDCSGPRSTSTILRAKSTATPAPRAVMNGPLTQTGSFETAAAPSSPS